MSRVPLEIEERVISRIRERRDAGRIKYGTTMERTDLPRGDWLRHAQEEALDCAIYLEKLLALLDETESGVGEVSVPGASSPLSPITSPASEEDEA